MTNRFHTLPVTKQAKILGISRGSVYYHPKPISEYDQSLMTRMDRLYMWPFAGARMLRDLLRQEGLTVGRKHVATLMRRHGA
jgi:putative transposase